jgi:hypothetical protein
MATSRYINRVDMLHRLAVLVFALAAMLAPPAVIAGDVTQAPPQTKAAPAQKGVAMPDASKLTLMVQLHVAALSLANITGNYSVLHALGTPDFQTQNPIEKLGQRFGAFRKNGIDISPALLYPPVLVDQPVIEANGVIRVAGFYATEPQRIAFQLAFQPINGMWRLADIDVRTLVPQPAPVADAKPGEPKKVPPAKVAKNTAQVKK